MKTGRLAASILFLFVSSSAVGVTHHVPAEFVTIQAALSAASPGDTILVAPGAYSGPGNTSLNFLGKDMILRSSGGREVTEIVGPGDGVFFESGESPGAILEGFTLRDLSRCIRISNSSPTIRDLHLHDNAHGGIFDWWYGGGISIGSASSSLISDCLIEDNYAWTGGAVGCVGSGVDPTFEDVVFRGNSGKDGGAVDTRWGAAPQFIRCVFDENVAHSAQTDDQDHQPGFGGAVFVWESEATFTDCLFSNNLAEVDERYWYPYESSGRGGAVFARDSESQPLFLRCTFWGNTAEPWEGDLRGGTISSRDDANVILEQVIIANSLDGGGIFTEPDGLVTISCSDVWGNAGGNYIGSIPDQTGLNGNFSADPLFCFPEGGDFRLVTGSPCLPENNDCGLPMGAFPEGCETPAHEISGTILGGEGLPIPGVEIVGGAYVGMTNHAGNYVVAVPDGWSGTLSPAKLHYSLDPPERSYIDVIGSHAGEDYTGTRSPVVHVPGEAATLLEAISGSQSGDTILVASGVYTGSGNRNLTLQAKDLVVIGTEGSEATILDCEGLGRAFLINQGESSDALIQGFTVTGGIGGAGGLAAGGALRVDGATPTLRDLVITNCSSTTWGGGLHVYDAPGISIEQLVLMDNVAAGNGGGLSLWNSTVTIDGLLAAGNTAVDLGGGLFFVDVDASLSGMTLAYNSAPIGGGMAGDWGSYSVTVSNSIIAFSSSGGGVFIPIEEIEFEISCSDVYGNEGGNYWGAIEDQTGLNGNISENPLFCDPEQGLYTLAADSPCLPENNACGVLMGFYGQGCDWPTGVEDLVADKPLLLHAHPNPFNPNTEMQFFLPNAGHVSLEVFDVGGRKVATILGSEWLEAGWHVRRWGGLNDGGGATASGVYLCRYSANGTARVERLVLLK